MKILSNFWIELFNENENLTSIITFPFYFIETFLTLCIFTTLLKIDLTKRQKMIYILTVSIVLIFSNIFIGDPYRLIINYGFVFILLYKIFNLDFSKSIFAIFMPFVFFAIINTIVLKPYLYLSKTSLDLMYVTPIYRFTYLCFVYILTALLIFLIRHFRYNYKLNIKSYISNDRTINKIIFHNILLGVITLFMQALLTYYYINIVPLWITIINIILLLSYFLLSFYSLTKATRLYLTTVELENAESYNKSLNILYDNVKGFKHDFDNMVNTIGGYINLNDIDGLKNYYSDLRKETITLKNISLLNPNIINNPGIYNLLISEYQKAQDKDVKINFEFFFNFENLQMPIYEFARILGILLDNAIDAAKECDEKVVNLVFRDSSKNKVQIIFIENTYKDKDIDTSKIFDKGVSGKENHTGIGLWEVKQIEKKYNNIVLHTSKDEKFFKQQLEIYY